MYSTRGTKPWEAIFRILDHVVRTIAVFMQRCCRVSAVVLPHVISLPDASREMLPVGPVKLRSSEDKASD
jgi:hypothetical protein